MWRQSLVTEKNRIIFISKVIDCISKECNASGLKYNPALLVNFCDDQLLT